jgi:hypothetical protein
MIITLIIIYVYSTSKLVPPWFLFVIIISPAAISTMHPVVGATLFIFSELEYPNILSFFSPLLLSCYYQCNTRTYQQIIEFYLSLLHSSNYQATFSCCLSKKLLVLSHLPTRPYTYFRNFQALCTFSAITLIKATFTSTRTSRLVPPWSVHHHHFFHYHQCNAPCRWDKVVYFFWTRISLRCFHSHYYPVIINATFAPTSRILNSIHRCYSPAIIRLPFRVVYLTNY